MGIINTPHALRFGDSMISTNLPDEKQTSRLHHRLLLYSIIRLPHIPDHVIAPRAQPRAPPLHLHRDNTCRPLIPQPDMSDVAQLHAQQPLAAQRFVHATIWRAATSRSWRRLGGRAPSARHAREDAAVGKQGKKSRIPRIRLAAGWLFDRERSYGSGEQPESSFIEQILHWYGEPGRISMLKRTIWKSREWWPSRSINSSVTTSFREASLSLRRSYLSDPISRLLLSRASGCASVPFDVHASPDAAPPRPHIRPQQSLRSSRVQRRQLMGTFYGWRQPLRGLGESRGYHDRGRFQSESLLRSHTVPLATGLESSVRWHDTEFVRQPAFRYRRAQEFRWRNGPPPWTRAGPRCSGPVRREWDVDARRVLSRLQRPVRLQFRPAHPWRSASASDWHRRRYHQSRRICTYFEPQADDRMCFLSPRTDQAEAASHADRTPWQRWRGWSRLESFPGWEVTYRAFSWYLEESSGLGSERTEPYSR